MWRVGLLTGEPTSGSRGPELITSALVVTEPRLKKRSYVFKKKDFYSGAEPQHAQ